MDYSLSGSSVLRSKDVGKNIGVGCYFLLQGNFLTQGLNQHLHWQEDSLPLSHQEPCIGGHKNGKEVPLSYMVPGITFCVLYHIYTLIYHGVAV